MAVNAFVCHVWGMAREDPHFRLRIPEDLKAQVEEAASAAQRSMTAEIVDRLRASFEGRKGLEREYVTQYVAALEAQNEALKKGQHLLETLLIDFAYALRQASQGDRKRLEDLIVREEKHSLLRQIGAAGVDLSEG